MPDTTATTPDPDRPDDPYPPGQSSPTDQLAAQVGSLAGRAHLALAAAAQSLNALGAELRRAADARQAQYALAPPPAERAADLCPGFEAGNLCVLCGDSRVWHTAKPAPAGAEAELARLVVKREESLHAAEQRAEEAEAAITRVRALTDQWERNGTAYLKRHADIIRAALDTPPICTCTYGERCPNCRAADQTTEEQGAPVDWQAIAEQRARELKAEGERRHAAENERNGAYRERAQLLALLATHYPALFAPAPDIDEPGWCLLFVWLPLGQASWHIAPADVPLFDHVELVGSDDPRARWDGHTTELKYARIAETIRRAAGQTTED